MIDISSPNKVFKLTWKEIAWGQLASCLMDLGLATVLAIRFIFMEVELSYSLFSFLHPVNIRIAVVLADVGKKMYAWEGCFTFPVNVCCAFFFILSKIKSSTIMPLN